FNRPNPVEINAYFWKGCLNVNWELEYESRVSNHRFRVVRNFPKHLGGLIKSTLGFKPSIRKSGTPRKAEVGIRQLEKLASVLGKLNSSKEGAE
ncbi:MAG: hypothetical protein AAF939_04510, partial [Planctomycetota bacterium]